MSKQAVDEIIVTHIFKSNDMVAESDLFLQFQIRELINRASGVPDDVKADILLYEAAKIKKDNEL